MYDYYRLKKPAMVKEMRYSSSFYGLSVKIKQFWKRTIIYLG